MSKTNKWAIIHKSSARKTERTPSRTFNKEQIYLEKKKNNIFRIVEKKSRDSRVTSSDNVTYTWISGTREKVDARPKYFSTLRTKKSAENNTHNTRRERHLEKCFLSANSRRKCPGKITIWRRKGKRIPGFWWTADVRPFFSDMSCFGSVVGFVCVGFGKWLGFF